MSASQTVLGSAVVKSPVKRFGATRWEWRLPYHPVTGDVRQANYSSLRAELVEFRRRVQQLQHGVIAHQLCRPVWARWLETAGLAGKLDLPDPAAARVVQWIPPRWDWVDPLKDIQAQVLAMEAGITSRRKVVEGPKDATTSRKWIARTRRTRRAPQSWACATAPVLVRRRAPARRRPRGPIRATGRMATATTMRRQQAARPNRSDIMNSWYTIRARDGGAEVMIYDEIGAYGVSAKGFLAELGALPDDAAIDLRLNSPGGSVFDAVAIHNALSRHAGTVTVWIDGIAASAASYVAMAGDAIVMPENAFLMIHDPSGLVMGTAADMRDMAGTLDKIAAGMTRGYAGRSGKPEDEIAALMAAETWFSAAEALDTGLAKQMSEPVRIAASFDIARFRNAPPELV
jgi:ATP-dependent protease ClpP protease subunit